MRFGGVFAAAILAVVIALPAPGLARNKNIQTASLPDNPVIEQADQIVVYKGQRRLVLLNDGRVLKSYRVALGKRPVGHKLFEGDFRTPEGRYYIDYRLRNSGYHRALHISYPNDSDIERSNILRTDPGGDIMIHGLPNGRGAIGAKHTSVDWTDGCVAVTNLEIEWLYKAAPDGTPVEISA